MSWGEVKYAINSTLGTEKFASIDTMLKNMYGEKLITKDDAFVVPEGVTELYISGCAAGGECPKGETAKAGEFVIQELLNVIPGQLINIIVGAGNTVITTEEYTKTLVANSITGCVRNNVLGYTAGVNGHDGVTSSYGAGGKGGSGGAFGFGGGGGGGSGRDTAGAIGVEGGNGGSAQEEGSSSETASLRNGAKGKTGSRYGGDGGGAGGYGAGAGGGGQRETGYYGSSGKPSNGMVFIQWGNLTKLRASS